MQFEDNSFSTQMEGFNPNNDDNRTSPTMGDPDMKIIDAKEIRLFQYQPESGDWINLRKHQVAIVQNHKRNRFYLGVKNHRNVAWVSIEPITLETNVSQMSSGKSQAQRTVVWIPAGEAGCAYTCRFTDVNACKDFVETFQNLKKKLPMNKWSDFHEVIQHNLEQAIAIHTALALRIDLDDSNDSGVQNIISSPQAHVSVQAEANNTKEMVQASQNEPWGQKRKEKKQRTIGRIIEMKFGLQNMLKEIDELLKELKDNDGE